VAHHREAKGIGRRDPLHTNSVEILDGGLAGKLPAFARGNLLISLPKIDRVAVVDFDAGRLVWSLKGSFRYQHDPTMLANGQMLIFDNKGLGDERSRVLQIEPETGEVVWSYGASESEAFYTRCCGRAHRLPNGNTLVIESKTARAFEVEPSGRLVWEFLSPHQIRGRAAILNDVLRLPAGSLRLPALDEQVD
jgi:outer membrane protein assembly factor BamB